MTTASDPIQPDSIITLLASPDLGQRLHAVNQTRYLEPDVGFSLLRQAAVDSNSRVRYAAISQMGMLALADPSPILALLRHSLETDPEYDVRAASAASLGDLKQPEALPDLLAAYERETEWLLQFSILAALGELGDLGAYDTVAGALEHENDLMKTAAAAALGDLGDPRAIPLLEALVDAEDAQLSYRAQLSLDKLKAASS